MNRRIPTIILITLLTLFLGVIGVIGQEPSPEGDGQPGGSADAAMVNSYISYQGKLEEDGSPVTGARDMTFRLYSDDACSIQVGSDIVRPGVMVTDGLFSVMLDVDQGDFNGQELWLGVDVGNTGSNILCDEIVPVPYALSLRPGAVISGAFSLQLPAGLAVRIGNSGVADEGAFGAELGRNMMFGGAGVYAYSHVDSSVSYGVWAVAGSGEGVHATSESGYGVYGASETSRGVYGRATASSGTNYGVYGWSSSTSGRGVYGGASASSGTTYGVYGATNSIEGAGVYALGEGSGADIILGGDSTSDDGKIYSDPTYSSSDIFLVSNDGVRVDLDADGDGEDADFEVRDKDDNLIFNVDDSGTTRVNVLQIAGGSDLAEPFEVAGAESVLPGMVVAIDPEHVGQLRVADVAYDRTVAGCVSGANGINPGLTMQQEGTVAEGSLPVALSGRVYCWADASAGPIQPGDLLTTSDSPGHAMKVIDHERAQGAILGKAMSPLDEGTGLVLVLVTLQ
jgi:hypothetical protein